MYKYTYMLYKYSYKKFPVFYKKVLTNKKSYVIIIIENKTKEKYI